MLKQLVTKSDRVTAVATDGHCLLNAVRRLAPLLDVCSLNNCIMTKLNDKLEELSSSIRKIRFTSFSSYDNE